MRMHGRLLVSVCLLFVMSNLSVDAHQAAAFGGDGSNPASCSGTTVITSPILSNNQVTIGQTQLRWGSCFFGSAWSRTCAKAGYYSSSFVARVYYPVQVGYGQATNLVSKQLASSTTCSGYANYSYSGTVFDNCSAAGYAPCLARATGQIFGNQSNTFYGDSIAGDY
jgi:hypothetical protein